MQITQTIQWIPQNWPSTSPASQYAIFLESSQTPLDTVVTTDAPVSYDDAGISHFVIRPTDGTNYGPAQTIVVGNGQVSTRGWVRNHVRKRVNDRADTGNSATNFPDDEINEYIAQALRDYSLRFPVEDDVTITCIAGGMMAGARDYQLPSNMQRVTRVRYTSANQLLQLELTEKPFKGGESTSGTMIGYPKLGVLVPPSTGRFYGGNYDLWEGKIHLDFDPSGDGDTLYIEYRATILDPDDDVTPFPVPVTDLELITLFSEAKLWEELEGRDASLSRWSHQDTSGRRDDLPTEKISARLRKLYEAKIQERLTVKPRVRRLVRR